jgi:hypothetical protein
MNEQQEVAMLRAKVAELEDNQQEWNTELKEENKRLRSMLRNETSR